MNQSPNEFSRRDFLRTTAGTAAAAGFAALTPAAWAAEAAAKPSLPYGVMGRTKFPATLISFGAIEISERLGTRILKAAIDQGVNLVHTSASYQNGKSITAVAGLFKEDKKYRDKVFLCLKSYHPERESEIDDMLKTLDTDHVEVVLTELHRPEMARLEAVQKQQDQLKKKGKVRHTGFVCHVDMNGVMEMLLEKAPDYFDMTLMSMKLLTTPDNKGAAADKSAQFSKNLKAMRAKGVGILSMKSGAKSAVTKGIKIFQPHAKFILEGGADSVLTSFSAIDQVGMLKEMDLKNPHLSEAEKKAAAEFHRSREDACLMCGDCTKACPQALPVNDLMRISMYHDEYGWRDHAVSEFARLNLNAGQLLSQCGDCTTCAEICPIKLAGANTVRHVASLFA